MRSVVVTGLGFTCCLGLETTLVSDRLRRLKHGFAPYLEPVEGDNPVKVAAPIPGFETRSSDPEDWTFPASLRFRIDQFRCLSPNVLYAVHAMEAAIADAGLDPAMVSSPRTGLYTASAGSAKMNHYHMDRLLRLGPARTLPMGMISSIAGTLNFNLVARYHIEGASTGFVSACASSAHALGFAYDEIARGRQDRMFVVGAEDFTPETVVPFGVMRVTSRATDPDAASRPFDRRRDGFVPTGGAVVMVLEAGETAAARGARARAEILGWGQASDGHHVAIPHPDGEGLRRAMESALKDAGLRPEAIDYINAHATSTPMGDIAECRAIKALFGREARIPVSSTKALTGHALSLAGAMEAAFCVLALDEGFTPGAAHLEEPDAETEGLWLPRETLSQAPRRVVSNSSGFGGANVSLVLGAAH
jgi:3-oxoacyl-[acyl-carrier-protein] synthase I